jgi:hypothetical protein
MEDYMKKFFGTILAGIVWLWREIFIWYGIIKKFITEVLDVFKGPSGSGMKVSHKRVIAAILTVVAIRQLIIGDHFGFLVATVIALILIIVTAITKT